MDCEQLIHKYYDDNPPLLNILLTHSRLVARKAMEILDKHPEVQADRQFVYEAAMLHDIGIYLTDAPAIHCHGTAHYLQHGPLGGELLRREGLPKHARVAERHTGTGMPGLEPETTEEIIVCYADKFFSKTKLEKEKSVEKVLRSLERFGQDGVERFLKWHALYC